MKRRILAAMPMISLLLFLVAGFVYGEWFLGVTFFLLPPLTAMLLTGNVMKRLNEAMPMIALAIFLWVGLLTKTWHPTWVVFFLIPAFNLAVEGRLKPRKLVSFGITIAYIGIGLYTKEWHPTWLIFLFIPIINTLFFPQPNAYFTFKTSDIKSKVRKVVEAELADDEDFNF